LAPKTKLLFSTCECRLKEQIKIIDNSKNAFFINLHLTKMYH